MRAPWQNSYVRLATLTALAALAAYVIAERVPHADPIPAAITAAVATRATFHHAAKETVFQTLGALLGAAIALVIVSVIGTGPWVIFLLVLLCFALARLLRLASPEESPFVAGAMAVTVILVVGTHFTNELALERFLGVVIGAACALAASALATPTRDTRLLRSQCEAMQESLSALLTQVSRAIRDDAPLAEARELKDEAIELRNQSLGISARFADLQAHRRWSPRIDPDDLAELGQLVDAVATMSARILSITTDLSGAGRPTDLPPAARAPLADLVSMAADNINAEDPATSVGRTQAHEAVRGADQTAQIALIGGIVSNVNRINQAMAEADADDDDHDHADSAKGRDQLE